MSGRFLVRDLIAIYNLVHLLALYPLLFYRNQLAPIWIPRSLWFNLCL